MDLLPSELVYKECSPFYPDLVIGGRALPQPTTGLLSRLSPELFQPSAVCSCARHAV